MRKYIYLRLSLTDEININFLLFQKNFYVIYFRYIYTYLNFSVKDIRRVKVNLLWFLKNIEIRKIRYYLGPDVEQYIRVNDWKTATFTIDIFDNAAGVNSFRFVREQYVPSIIPIKK